MSIFNAKLKTFESDLLGEKKSFKLNNAVWLFMDSEFGVKQSDWSDSIEEEPTLTYSKFATAVLLANGYETTLQDVVEHTDATAVARFADDFFKCLLGIEDDAELEEMMNQMEGDSGK